MEGVKLLSFLLYLVGSKLFSDMQVLFLFQAKFRRMVDENRSVATRIDGEIRQAHEEMAALREELADTSRRFEEHLTTTTTSAANNNTNNTVLNGNKTSSESSELTSVTSTSSGSDPPKPELAKSPPPFKINSPLKIRLDNLSPKEAEFPVKQTNGDSMSAKDIGAELDKCAELALELGEDLEPVNGESLVSVKQLIRPPSPIPGPSNKPDFGEFFFIKLIVTFSIVFNELAGLYLWNVNSEII